MHATSERKIPPPPWKAVITNLHPPEDPAALSDGAPFVRSLIAAFGLGRAAELLDVDSGAIESQGDPVSAGIGHRAIELYDVLTRALRVFDASRVMRWLGDPEPYLGGRRPIDVVAAHGAAPVIVTLETLHAEMRHLQSRLENAR